MTASTALRCAYCHGPFAAPGRACDGCATVLHADCWSLAEACPTLGCGHQGRAPLGVSKGAAVWHSRLRGASWLLLLLGVTALLALMSAPIVGALLNVTAVRVVNEGGRTLHDVVLTCSDTGLRRPPLRLGDLAPGESRLEVVKIRDSVIVVHAATHGRAASRRTVSVEDSLGLMVGGGQILDVELTDTTISDGRTGR